jgi:hypothetical protein
MSGLDVLLLSLDPGKNSTPPDPERSPACRCWGVCVWGGGGKVQFGTTLPLNFPHVVLVACKPTGDPTGQLLTAAEVATLLAKEQLNCFGLLAPLHMQQSIAAAAPDADDGEDSSSSRKLRGGALYPICALLNHECIPNVARFDALDAAVGGSWPAQWPKQQQQQQLVAAVAGDNAAAAAALTSAAGLSAGPHGGSSGCGCGGTARSGGGCGSCSTTLVTMRALHALPAGTEVVLSYMPLNWDLEERQHQTEQVSLQPVGGGGACLQVEEGGGLCVAVFC